MRIAITGHRSLPAETERLIERVTERLTSSCP